LLIATVTDADKYKHKIEFDIDASKQLLSGYEYSLLLKCVQFQHNSARWLS